MVKANTVFAKYDKLRVSNIEAIRHGFLLCAGCLAQSEARCEAIPWSRGCQHSGHAHHGRALPWGGCRQGSHEVSSGLRLEAHRAIVLVECVFSFAIKPHCLMRSMSLACNALFLIRRSLISPNALLERKLLLVEACSSGLHL